MFLMDENGSFLGSDFDAVKSKDALASIIGFEVGAYACDK